jgi:hypothetical protein
MGQFSILLNLNGDKFLMYFIPNILWYSHRTRDLTFDYSYPLLILYFISSLNSGGSKRTKLPIGLRISRRLVSQPKDK